jgi:predicted protein tyrosine phosphatase
MCLSDGKTEERFLLPEVIIASRAQAERLLMSKDRGRNIQHVISIGAAREPVPAGFEFCAGRIRLEFFDVSSPEFRRHGPQVSDVERVIEFAQRIQHEGGRLLVHCGAGISRSTKEQDAVYRTYAAQPQAQPNSLFVELADGLLERNGALIAAVNRASESLDLEALMARYLERMDVAK